MKKLAKLQSVFEIAKIVMLVMMIALIVTEALNVVALIVAIAFPADDAQYMTDLGNMLSMALFGVGTVILLILGNRFFKEVCIADTPFSAYCAQQLALMAKVCLISKVAALLLCYGIDLFLAPVPEARLTNYTGIALGAVLYIAAKVLDYGAELEEKNEKQRKQIEQLQKESRNS